MAVAPIFVQSCHTESSVSDRIKDTTSCSLASGCHASICSARCVDPTCPIYSLAVNPTQNWDFGFIRELYNKVATATALSNVPGELGTVSECANNNTRPVPLQETKLLAV